MPNGWRTINSLVHKIRLHGRRGKGMAESFSRQKSRHAPQKEGGLKILCDLPPVWPRLVRPTNLMSRMDGKKTHTHTSYYYLCVCVFFPFILDIKSVGRTSRGHTGGRSHRTSHPPFSAVRALTFLARGIPPKPGRPWSRILCTNDLIVLHPLGIFSF